MQGGSKMTDSNLRVRSAIQTDAPRIVSLARQSFPYLELSVLGCEGAESYVNDTIQLADESAVGWTVACFGSDLVAMAEVRQSSSEAFLNHICVDPQYQGRGVGRLVLLASLSSLRSSAREFVLDVFSDNRVAKAWYRSLGFAVESQSHWIALSPDSDGSDGWWATDGVPQANAVHARYGFSQFQLETSSGSYRIGRLGQRTLRASGIARDRVARQALQDLYPHRRLLSAEQDPGNGESTFPPSERMRADLKVVIEALRGRS